MNPIAIIPVTGIREVAPGDDLAALISGPLDVSLQDGDVVVVAQKIVSKAEDRTVPGSDRRRAAVDESVRILRRTGDMIISETRHGFVCANSGVDASNVEGDSVLLLPLDPDLSARRLRAGLKHLTGADVAVIVADTFGRAWRIGQTNVAIGVAGMDAFTDYRGGRDAQGRDLTATRICTADEIAGAAELVMGKTAAIPVAVVRGATIVPGRGSARDIVRPPEEDLFR